MGNPSKLFILIPLTLLPMGMQVGCSSGGGSGAGAASAQTSFNVHGSVADGNGNPLSGIQVSIAAASGSTTSSTTIRKRQTVQGGSSLGVATTDAKGNYTLAGLPQGTYVVTPSVSGATASLFLPSERLAQVADSNVEVDFQATLGYTVSGTVSYTSSNVNLAHTIYLLLTGSPSGTSVYQAPVTLVNGSGTFQEAFAIQGVQPGTYTLNATLDLLGGDFPNVNNPSGSSPSITVQSTDVAVGQILLTDPAASAALDASMAPATFTVTPMPGGVAVRYSPIKAVSGMEQPTSYTVEWNTQRAFSDPTLGGSVSFPANGPGIGFIQNGTNLANGTPYWFRVNAHAGANASGFTTLAAQVSPGDPDGSYAISGTVAFAQTVPAGSYLYVGALDEKSGQVYAKAILNPVSTLTAPQAYTIAGVPNGTDFRLFAFLDTQKTGFFGPGGGGVQSTDPDATAPISVQGSSLTAQNLVLTSASASASVTSVHSLSSQAGESYGLQFSVLDGGKHVTGVRLLSGPNVLAPRDLAVIYPYFSLGAGTALVAPEVGDSYQFQVAYSDGNTDAALTTTVSAVLGLAQNLATGVTGFGVVDPSFSWDAPDANAAYLYRFLLSGTASTGDDTGGTIWQVPSSVALAANIPFGFASPSLQMGTDPLDPANVPTVGGLTQGRQYVWTVGMVDGSGNLSSVDQTFVP